ncbi:MAG: hypothetical protein HQM11_12095 [SAR324 cluster bacterium]|nr:hypothetical protein [SAR324 cluster bacterium]
MKVHSPKKMALVVLLLAMGLTSVLYNTELALSIYPNPPPITELLLSSTSSEIPNLTEKLMWHYPLRRGLNPSTGELAQPFQSRSMFQGIQLSSIRFLKFPYPEEFDLRTNLTLSFWFIPDFASLTNPALKNIVWVGNPNTPGIPYFSMWYSSQSGSEKLHISSVLGKANIPFVIQEEQFYRVTLTYQAESRTLKLFVNGKEILFQFFENNSAPSPSPPLHSVFQIAQGYAPSSSLSAIYGGVILWGRALETAEIQTLHSWSQIENQSAINDYTEELWRPQLQLSSWQNHLLWSYPLHHDTHSTLESSLMAKMEENPEEIFASAVMPTFGHYGMELSYARFLQLPKAKDLDFHQDFSLSFWLVPLDIQDDSLKNIFWLGNPAQPGTPYFSLWYRESHSFHISSVLGHANIPYELQFDHFYHFLLIYNRENTTLKLLINGQELPVTWLINGQTVELANVVPFLPALDRTLDVFYWAKGLAPTTGLNGLYGDLAFWKKSLSLSEAQEQTSWMIRKNSSFLSDILILQSIFLYTCVVLVFIFLMCCWKFMRIRLYLDPSNGTFGIRFLGHQHKEWPIFEQNSIEFAILLFINICLLYYYFDFMYNKIFINHRFVNLTWFNQL